MLELMIASLEFLKQGKHEYNQSIGFNFVLVIVIVIKKSTFTYEILPGGVKKTSQSIRKMIVLYAIKMSHAEIIAYKGSI